MGERKSKKEFLKTEKVERGMKRASIKKEYTLFPHCENSDIKISLSLSLYIYIYIYNPLNEPQSREDSKLKPRVLKNT